MSVSFAPAELRETLARALAAHEGAAVLAFRQCDRSGRGLLTCAEFSRAVHSLRLGARQQTIEGLFYQVDGARIGRVDYARFLAPDGGPVVDGAALEALCRALTRSCAELDAKGDLEELRVILYSKAVEVVKRWHVEGTGLICKQSFLRGLSVVGLSAAECAEAGEAYTMLADGGGSGECACVELCVELCRRLPIGGAAGSSRTPRHPDAAEIAAAEGGGGSSAGGRSFAGGDSRAGGGSCANETSADGSTSRMTRRDVHDLIRRGELRIVGSGAVGSGAVGSGAVGSDIPPMTRRDDHDLIMSSELSPRPPPPRSQSR